MHPHSIKKGCSLMMYSRTSVCPYTGRCDNYQSIVRIQDKLHKERREFVMGRRKTPLRDYEEIMEDYQKKMENLIRAKEKCIQYHKRCLKYWRFNKLKEEEPIIPYKLQEKPIVVEDV